MIYESDNIYIDRKKRIALQNDLIKKFKTPLLIMKFNYLGQIKSNDIIDNIIKIMDEVVSDIFNSYICFKLLRITEEGPYSIIMINKNAIEIKKTSIEIEDKHTLGQCVDIDIYDKNMKKISRIDLGYELRKCYVCNNNAKQCIKEKRHTNNEIMQCIIKKYKEYMENFYGKKSVNSMGIEYKI